MSKIPTAESLLQDKDCVLNDSYRTDYIVKKMTEFAKLHVKQALLKASEKAKVSLAKDWIRKEETIHPNSLVSSITVKVDKESIISAYDLNNIK